MGELKLETFEEIKTLKEKSNIEFKESTERLGNSFWETYSSFANTEGGVIILGVKEKKLENNIIGVLDVEKIIKEITTGANNQDLVNKNILKSNSIKIIKENEKSIVLVEIPKIKYTEKPIYLKGKIANTYKRLHESDQKCSQEEIKGMIRDSSSALDRIILNGYDEDDLDQITLEKYRLRMKEVAPRSPFNEIENMGDFLIASGILSKNRETKKYELTLGGLLMLGKTNSIKSKIAHFHLEYIDKSDRKVERWLDRIIYDGSWGEENLFNFYNAIITKLEANIKTPFKLKEDGLTRDDDNDFKKALREALLNTLIHADYEFPSGIIISKLEDEYVFENPGLLRLTIEEIFEEKIYSDPRNPLIMDLFRFIKLSERSGTGIKTILHAVDKLELKKPKIIQEKSKVKFILPDTQILDDENLNKEEKIVLAYILKNGEIKNQNVQDKLKVGKTYALKILKQLVEKDFIIQHGKGSGSKYKKK